ncbi:MAG: glycosyltransferase family 4 protein [Dehalococcoidia bacterium]
MSGRTLCIAFIIDVFAPNAESGFGGSVYLSGLVSRLTGLGVECRIVTRSGSVQPSVSGQVIPIGRVPYTKTGYVSKLRFSHDLWNSRSLFDGVDLVHSLSAASIPFLHYLHRSGVPTVFDCRTAFLRTSRRLAMFQAVALAFCPPSRVLFCDAISAVEYRRFMRRGALLLPVPVECSAASEAAPIRPRLERILFATQLSEEKGLPDLLEAMALLRRRGVCVSLHVAGDGPLRPLVERIAARHDGRLVYHGLLSQPAVAALLPQMDLLVHPSYWESVSRSVLEAMGQGLPVVTTDVGGMQILARHGLIASIPPRNGRALADAVEQLGSDYDRRQELCERGRRYVLERHGWQHVFPPLCRLYRELGVRVPDSSVA